ncbi:type II toxin-antitoxin system RelE/ParE family toxin [Pedobacter sp. SL55]|uniref:type II toxin-antitoxin system RelE/ParE family toxin n=1 Tax=Pedobacter sp. SL55 TaxID=2995161 RepID=UPI00226F0453|nr:type II toxin-antitoxin system RelE/ParE family toxin [Pedobacter sp. SL55]WAC41552.1 type II toxin-antitoxin system RelE/ParE family toxin [Pedobacter sp. SL55]
MQIVWSPQAEETFDSIINFIINNWGVSASKNFIKKNEEIIDFNSFDAANVS